MPLRRLTAREYLNTVRDLLGDTTLDAGDVPNESDDLSNNAFPFRQPGVVGNFEAGNLQLAAEALAKNAASKLTSLLPCTPVRQLGRGGLRQPVHHRLRAEGLPPSAQRHGESPI